jgi:hypothetical protein
MGLNAAVYWPKEMLGFSEEDLPNIDVDPRTGQFYFETAELDKVWGEKIKAVDKRIGNISSVGLLRQEIEGVLGTSHPETLLISRVLYNGVHSGDIIQRKELGELRREIALVRDASGHSSSAELEVFLADMHDLIDASEKCGNPIVFI